MLDTLRQVETPEGVTLNLRVAGVAPRAAAWAVDALIRFILFSILATVFATLLGKGGVGLVFLTLFVLFWFYMVLFEALNQGRTPGKLIMGIRVVSDNALPVSWTGSVVRNLLRTVDMFPVFYGFGLVAMLLDRDFRRLGDRVAGTLVVYDQHPGRSSAPRATQAVPPVLALTTDEQVALLSFAERAGHLTDERQAELAGILQPLTGRRGEASVQLLLGYANWIAGRH